MHFFNVLAKNAAAAAMNFKKIYRCRGDFLKNLPLLCYHGHLCLEYLYFILRKSYTPLKV
jgi:hypothetical protein